MTMNCYKIENFKDDNGFDPVQFYINHLDPNRQQPIILSSITRLRNNGLLLLQTHLVKVINVKEHLYEIVKANMRIAFYEQGNLFILLHGFPKKTNRTDPKDLKIIYSRLEILKGRCKK